jgi:cysteine desulfurase family protein
LIYFDNAATTFPKPEAVYEFTDKFYREYGVNVGRGQHKLADKASGLVAETRSLLLDMLHCPNKQVVFTPSATEALNIILQGLNWRGGLNVYITPFEHNAVLRVLHHISGIYELNIKELEVNCEYLTHDIERIKYQFQLDKPDVVIMSHASNVCGLVAPIKEICELAKKHEATTVIDMAQTAGLLDTDLSRVQADYAVFAGHKTLYSTFGIAGFVTDKGKELSPLIFGGTGVDSASLSLPIELPAKFEVGSINVAAVAGLNAALKWIKETTIDSIRKKENHISDVLTDLLCKYRNIKVVGIGEGNHIGVISCTFDGYSADAIGQVLSDHNIAVRTGLHCAPAAHKFLGTFPSGTVRFSVGYFNTDEDIVALDSALQYIKENS